MKNAVAGIAALYKNAGPVVEAFRLRGLKPEERWWLYTMTAAATGLAHQTGMGWRAALRQALCFGTRSDTFHLGAVAGRGTLEPRVNASFAQPKKKNAGKKDDNSGLLFTPFPAE